MIKVNKIVARNGAAKINENGLDVCTDMPIDEKLVTKSLASNVTIKYVPDTFY